MGIRISKAEVGHAVERANDALGREAVTVEYVQTGVCRKGTRYVISVDGGSPRPLDGSREAAAYVTAVRIAHRYGGSSGLAEWVARYFRVPRRVTHLGASDGDNARYRSARP